MNRIWSKYNQNINTKCYWYNELRILSFVIAIYSIIYRFVNVIAQYIIKLYNTNNHLYFYKSIADIENDFNFYFIYSHITIILYNLCL